MAGMGGGRGAMEKLLLERLGTVIDNKEKNLAFRRQLKKIRDCLKSKLNQLGDSDGKVVSLVYGGGKVFSLFYDGGGKLLSLVDGDGKVFSLVDDDGKVFSLVDGDGKVDKINERDMIREHLFHLNNLMIEARRIPTHYRCVTSDYYSVRAAIKQLKSEVVDVKKTPGSGSQEHSAPARIQNQNQNDVSATTPTTIPRVTSAPARMQNAVEGEKTKSELDWKVEKVRRWSMLSLPKEIRGFESDELAMENLLLYHSSSSSDAEETEEADFNAVGIVGAEGVGKTTLAWKVLNRPLIAKAFLPRILINDIDDNNGSENDNVIKKKIAIARRILSALGVDDETIITSAEPRRPNLELAALICAIRSELMGKRYLAVLDGVSSLDVWEVDKEEKLLAESLWFAFPRGSGGAVVVTGRDIKEAGKENLVTEMVRRARGDRWVKKKTTTTAATATTPTQRTETTPTPAPTTERYTERDDYDEKRKIYRLIPLDNPTECWKIYKDEIGEEALKEDVDKDLLELRRDGMTGEEEAGEEAGKEDVDKEQPESARKDDRAQRMTVQDEVIQKCKGYPMAARMMAVIRKDQLEEKKKREDERKRKAQEEEDAKKKDQHHSSANPGTTTTTTTSGGNTTNGGGNSSNDGGGGGGGGGGNSSNDGGGGGGGGGEIQEHGENDS